MLGAEPLYVRDVDWPCLDTAFTTALYLLFTLYSFILSIYRILMRLKCPGATPTNSEIVVGRAYRNSLKRAFHSNRLLLAKHYFCRDDIPP